MIVVYRMRNQETRGHNIHCSILGILSIFNAKFS